MANANTNIHRKRLPMKMPGTVCKALIEKACKASHRFVISFYNSTIFNKEPDITRSWRRRKYSDE